MITDNTGHQYTLNESDPGTYLTDQNLFRGIIGRIYTLHISFEEAGSVLSYESLPMEMKPVPEIDSLFYEKKVLQENDEHEPTQEGCQVYLNTYDQDGLCKHYRWDFTETWQFRLPYEVTNQVCWITDYSKAINIKNTSVFSETRINRYPLNFISNETDRLREKYSMTVNQYSLSEDEYNYWEKLQSISDEVGGLYDIIPASIPGNIFSVQNPSEKVLGYFSVSARSSKRIYVVDSFAGLPDLYSGCATDTVPTNAVIDGLNSWVWIIIRKDVGSPPFYLVLTNIPRCADCSFRGSPIKPDYWDEDE
jgi:hypothetical protein